MKVKTEACFMQQTCSAAVSYLQASAIEDDFPPGKYNEEEDFQAFEVSIIRPSPIILGTYLTSVKCDI